jgi:hypothetical protein
VAANSLDRLTISFNVDSNYEALRLGFLQGANPSAYKRLLSVATLNAARTMVAPMRAEAPIGKTTKTPGRLRKSVTARRARFNTPAAVVGPRAGRNRAGVNGGAWYRWFVTSGISGVRQTKNGPKAVKAVPANPFVTRVSKNEGRQRTAMEAMAKTVESFFNNEVFRNTILRFKRGR